MPSTLADNTQIPPNPKSFTADSLGPLRCWFLRGTRQVKWIGGNHDKKGNKHANTENTKRNPGHLPEYGAGIEDPRNGGLNYLARSEGGRLAVARNGESRYFGLFRPNSVAATCPPFCEFPRDPAP